MVRTQIYLDDQLINNLRIGAKLNKTTVSKYIRTLLCEKIAINKLGSKKLNLVDLANLGKKITKSKTKINISGNMDKYLPEEWR